MQLIDEEHNIAVRLAHVREDVLEPLLKLAAELCAGDKRAHVKRVHARAAQGFRHIAGDDTLRQALRDGCLADAGLADDDGVVLGPPRQDLHDALNLCLTSDDGVKLAVLRKVRQVNGVLVQRARGCAVRPRAAGLTAPPVCGRAPLRFPQGRLQPRLRQVECAENRGGLAVVDSGCAKEQMLRPDLFRAQTLCGHGGAGQQPLHAGRQIELRCAARHLWRVAQSGVNPIRHGIDINIQPLQERDGGAVRLLQDGVNHVLNVELAVAHVHHRLLGDAQHLLGAFRKPIRTHHG